MYNTPMVVLREIYLFRTYSTEVRSIILYPLQTEFIAMNTWWECELIDGRRNRRIISLFVEYCRESKISRQ